MLIIILSPDQGKLLSLATGNFSLGRSVRIVNSQSKSSFRWWVGLGPQVTASRAWACEVRHNHRSLSLFFLTRQAGNQPSLAKGMVHRPRSSPHLLISHQSSRLQISHLKVTPKRLEMVRLGLLMSSGPSSHVHRNRPQLGSHAQELSSHAH